MKRVKIAVIVAAMVLTTSAYAHPETHYRKLGGSTWVCHYDGESNWGFCGRTTLAEVKKINALAEDDCRHLDNDGIVPHSTTGEAEELNYACRNGHMVRDAYTSHFTSDGYSYQQWKPMR